MNKNITKHYGLISKEDRQRKNGHKSKIVWFTGLSGSGKSTLAVHLERELFARGVNTYILDGDNMRLGLNKDLKFSKEDRKENIRRLSEVGKLFVDAGIVVLVSAISPFKKDRDEARKIFKTDEFIEVYVKCSLHECERRDPKGLYKKARAGLIKDFTGISSPYEPPEYPDLILETDKESIKNMVTRLIDYLVDNGLFEV
ncbi:adenylyl-sulfate kinase [Vulcanibacillus modesticaldus]|uniref:Adenylyl-sulfate kinase n=1 Tax=Vulcanibacillus modesticaldus TaxID=337097 RepID=A0A1D2YT54_9BACI|nr:adenylyl-sulfate kinase [Vulcanibacillus modesticaldus]OEF98871.1 adenylyl-sulfate kinase [Vulcanibacillus modesticaldus]